MTFPAILLTAALGAAFAVGCHSTARGQQGTTTALAATATAGSSKVYFVRHAQTEKNAAVSCREDAFAPLGQSQVSKLTDKLGAMGVHFDHVFISPLWRTQNTIAPFLAKHPQLYDRTKVVTDEGLAECCWDLAHNQVDPVRQSAKRIRALVEASPRPLNILVVSHYFAGGDFGVFLLGKVIKPRNAEVSVLSVPKRGGAPLDHPEPLPVPGPTLPADACAAAAGTCVDLAKGQEYSCIQQKAWGKCDEEWMVSGDYCRKSCGRCEE